MLENTPNQLTKFRAGNWVEINDKSQPAYNNNSNENNNNIKFKKSMIRPNLCDYNDAYIFVKETVAVPNSAAEGAAVNDTNKEVVFKYCAPFPNCTTKMNNTHLKNAEHTDIVMPVYNLTECSDSYIRHQEVYDNATEIN